MVAARGAARLLRFGESARRLSGEGLWPGRSSRSWPAFRCAPGSLGRTAPVDRGDGPVLAPPLNPRRIFDPNNILLSSTTSRPDLSPHLIHFTKAAGSLDAFSMLLKIIGEKRLRGSDGFVKGGATCISFTEAPFEILAEGLANPHGETRYSGFGLRFHKAQIYRLGGRPVIYQPDREYHALPAALRWRHVRFEPLAEPPIDWTWEREWRLPLEELPFTENDIEVVVPDDEAAGRFVQEFERESHNSCMQWEVVLGQIAWLYHEPNPWRILRSKGIRGRADE